MLTPDAEYQALAGAPYILPPTHQIFPAMLEKKAPMKPGWRAGRMGSLNKFQLSEYNDDHGLHKQLMKLLIVAIPPFTWSPKAMASMAKL
jgi:hypothetical protein